MKRMPTICGNCGQLVSNGVCSCRPYQEQESAADAIAKGIIKFVHTTYGNNYITSEKLMKYAVEYIELMYNRKVENPYEVEDHEERPVAYY